ncbi:nudix hydrolase 20 [Amanita muscaria]|uniref:Nudix hydrolase domain-containing protein n=1 Tax=Amanita muscaria (strain Koide BX008) TaxID=946122 RepID=A0A0C2X9U3_AMAMK|nr:hypothetical protein M378DRAFT_75701 [Amanita muscaria Koide BX008]
MSAKSLSYLDLVNICDNVHIGRKSPILSPFDSEKLVPLHLSEEPESPAIGLLRPIIVEQLTSENEQSRKNARPEMWVIAENRVSFSSWLNTAAKRTEAMIELCERWRDTGLFTDVCGPKKWRSEMYPVYRDPFGIRDHPSTNPDETKLNYAFELERSACALFGIITYGVHMSVFQEKEVDGERQLFIWVPTRAKTKQTFPGFLDNTVAGGIPSGMSAFDSMVKECEEEASYEPKVVKKYTRAVGCISYFFRTAAGWLQPEVEFVYDIAMPPDVDPTLFRPKPMDGEVEKFEFLDQNEIEARMRAGLFKPNCGIVIIDLLIRLGYITPDNEPDFLQIITRLHGRFDYDRWSL